MFEGRISQGRIGDRFEVSNCKIQQKEINAWSTKEIYKKGNRSLHSMLVRKRQESTLKVQFYRNYDINTSIITIVTKNKTIVA